MCFYDSCWLASLCKLQRPDPTLYEASGNILQVVGAIQGKLVMLEVPINCAHIHCCLIQVFASVLLVRSTKYEGVQIS